MYSTQHQESASIRPHRYRRLRTLLRRYLAFCLALTSIGLHAQTIPSIPLPPLAPSIVQLFYSGIYYADSLANRSTICALRYGTEYSFEPGCAFSHGCSAGWSCQGFPGFPIMGCPTGYTLSGNSCLGRGCPEATPGYTLSPDGASCSRNDRYRLVLHAIDDANATQGDVEPGKALGLRAVVYDANGQPVAGVTLDIKAEVVANSGGHAHHDSDRPKGTVPGTGVTTAGGFDFSFTAPVVAGDHTVTVSCGGCEGVGSFGVWVGVRGLESLQDRKEVYELVGERPEHPANHYLTMESAARMVLLASTYTGPFRNDPKNPRPVLHLNDASLIRGGKFDIYQTWGGSHFEHCRGTAIDIRANDAPGAVPVDTANQNDVNRVRFEIAAKAVKSEAKFEIPMDKKTGKFWWHLRHFHVWLLGSKPICP